MLTPREQDTYRFIHQYLLRHGHAPLLREIAEDIGITSQGAVHKYLQALEQKGMITFTEGHRGIQLTKKVRPGRLPLLGRIAAGKPIEAIVDEEDINLLDFFMGPNRFVLRVQGDSMIEAGIMDKDMVIVEKRDRASNGDIVVALIDSQEATLKTLKHNKDRTLTLVPANAKLKPLTYSADRVAIQGVVIGQMRSYR